MRKVVSEQLGLPLRAARVARGRGRGEDEDEETVAELDRRVGAKVRLLCLAVESRRFKDLRRRGLEKVGAGTVVTDTEVQAEKRRRGEMAALRRELYGGGVGVAGKLASDPEWDDVVPVVLQEPEKALAAITYPQDYAEGESISFVGVGISGN